MDAGVNPIRKNGKLNHNGNSSLKETNPIVSGDELSNGAGKGLSRSVDDNSRKGLPEGLSRSVDDNLRKGLPKGLYIYSIRTIRQPSFKSEKSIDGQGRAFSILYNDIEAIVSEVDLGVFASEEIQKKAEEDLLWIKEKCRLHEDVIEQSMREGSKIISVIPMKFGIIFKTREQLEKNLAENYSNIKNRLAEIQGKQEYGIKIYLDEKSFVGGIEQKDEIIKKKKKEIEKLPQGMAFFEQKKLDDQIREICSRHTERLTHEIYEELFNAAEDGTREKTLGREITGEKEPMIFNAYFLIKEEKIGDFIRILDKIKEKHGNIGYRIRCTGPLPNYHFVESFNTEKQYTEAKKDGIA